MQHTTNTTQELTRELLMGKKHRHNTNSDNTKYQSLRLVHSATPRIFFYPKGHTAIRTIHQSCRSHAAQCTGIAQGGKPACSYAGLYHELQCSIRKADHRLDMLDLWQPWNNSSLNAVNDICTLVAHRMIRMLRTRHIALKYRKPWTCVCRAWHNQS